MTNMYLYIYIYYFHLHYIFILLFVIGRDKGGKRAGMMFTDPHAAATSALHAVCLSL